MLFIFVTVITRISSYSQPYRSVYIDNFLEILGDSTQEAEVLSWAVQEGVNSLSLYDLQVLLCDASRHESLASFVHRAKALGLKVVAVLGGSYTASQCLLPYIQSNDRQSSFDALNLEKEWWNGDGDFQEFRKEVDKIRQIDLPLENYIGWLSRFRRKRALQADFLVENSDIMTIHVYQVSPKFSYVMNRLKALNKAALKRGKQVSIVFIFSVEDHFSGPYSAQLKYSEMYNRLIHGLDQNYDGLIFSGWKVFCYTNATQYRPLKNSE